MLLLLWKMAKFGSGDTHKLCKRNTPTKYISRRNISSTAMTIEHRRIHIIYTKDGCIEMEQRKADFGYKRREIMRHVWMWITKNNHKRQIPKESLRTRQQQCQEQRQGPNLVQHSFQMFSSSPIIAGLLFLMFITPVSSGNNTFRPDGELRKYWKIKAHLRRLNKPLVKTIQSPDGDLIDCVPSHLQPAFDHPRLKGHKKPLDPPERPKGHSPINNNGMDAANVLQSWQISGESCLEGTIPIRRTTEQDILRATSIKRFGRKPVAAAKSIRRDSVTAHEHAVGYVEGDQYYGAKASLNVWAPNVTNASEFSLSQIWVISGSFDEDLNTIEAGWQVSPQLYGDSSPRFFTYWTTDAYQATGCYNLLCSGFIQTNNMIAIGAAITPSSVYNGGQFDISVLVWKDPKHGNWWLELGSGQLVGYWPSTLFSHLTEHASMVQFGGEIVNTETSGFHTSTQMGSGRFPRQGFGRASYFRNLQVVDWDNSLIPLPNLRLLADNPDCYDIQGGMNTAWGNYFYYGGPGRNMRCP